MLICAVCAILGFTCNAVAQDATPSTVSAQVDSTAPAAPAGVSREADAEMANRVREEFRHSWDGYKKYAWGHDDLKPLSKSYHDWYASSLLMSPVDGLDTMIVMGMDDEAAKTRE